MIVHPSDRPGSGLGQAAGAVADLSIEAVVSILAEYGLDLELVRRGETTVSQLAMEEGVGPFGLGAVVHFVGGEVRGSLLLASTCEVITPTRPCSPKRFASLAPSAKAIMTQDWMGELANQVLGRLKATLAAFGIAFDTHAPVPLSREALRRVVPKSVDTRPVVFRAPIGAVGFSFDIVCSGDVNSSASPASGSTNRVMLF